MNGGYFEAKEIDQEIKRRRGPVEPSAWTVNLLSLQEGAFGDPKRAETMVRYWKAQEAAGYPHASENVQYFTGIVEKEQRERQLDHIEAVLQRVKQYLRDILDEWYRRQDEPNFYEQNIMVYNHVRKELDDLYAFAEKCGVKLDEEDEIDAKVR